MTGDSIQIRTPEGVVFAQRLAGPVTRFCAWSIDLLCIIALVYAAGKILLVFGLFGMSLAAALTTLSYFAFTVGYGIVCEWFWRGQTVGKRLLRLRVVDIEGMRLRFDQVVVRNLVRCVDALPMFYFLGGLICLLTPRRQRLGDLAANTIVVSIPREAQPDVDRLLAGKFNSLRQHPHLAARLRHRVSQAEAAVALQALMRREEFDPIARVGLFGDLAAYFRGKVEFPAEATDGISDEQQLRNVVDVVYRRL